MSGWIEFTAALAAFLASHIVPIRLKGGLVAVLGRRGYVAAFSLLSLGLLYWLILAAGRAPIVEIWPQQGWMRWLVNIAMPLAFGLGATGGMAGLMAGFALWAGAHLVANGDLAHVILFGLMLAYALAGLARVGRFRLRLTPMRLAVGAVLWAGAWHLHPAVIGASPMP